LAQVVSYQSTKKHFFVIFLGHLKFISFFLKLKVITKLETQRSVLFLFSAYHS
jgi:hypothetical protein